MQNEGVNGGESCEKDLEKQAKIDEEGLSVEGCGDESNQTQPTIVISSGESHDSNNNENAGNGNDSKIELAPVVSPKKGFLSRSSSSSEQCRYIVVYVLTH